MLTERKSIQEAIQFNQEEIKRLSEERRMLFDQNLVFTKRIREIDEIERGTGQLVIVDPMESMRLHAETNQLLTRLIPNVTLDRLTDLLEQEALDSARELFTEETTTTTKKTTTFVEESEETTVTKKQKRNDFKKQAPTVASILSEFGRPTSLQDLTAILEKDHEIKWSQPSQAMDSIMRFQPRISRAGHGVYQLSLH